METATKEVTIQNDEKRILGFSRNVFFLGLTSLFNDIASEMVYPLIPIFLTSVLGAPVAFIGIIEGIAESTASLVKMISGWFSDRVKNRKILAVSGYGLSTLAKPLLVFSFIWWQVLGARFSDRLGKGIRTSPRDALISDSTEPNAYGRSFGLHRAMDTVGAAIGPLIAFIVFPLLDKNYRLYFSLAIIPALAGVFVLSSFVKEPRHGVVKEGLGFSLKPFDKNFKLFLISVLVFTLGNSSDAFLILRAKNVGVAVALIPLAYLLFNLVSAAVAIPVGSISDRIGRRWIIALGYIAFSAVYLGFALAKHPITIWVLFAAYGLYFALTESIFKAYTADLAPKNLRGTAYGLLNLSLGIALLPASLIGGLLWQYISPAATFFYGSITSLLALALFMLFVRSS